MTPSSNDQIRLAIVGVGNCASALVQGAGVLPDHAFPGEQRPRPHARAARSTTTSPTWSSWPRSTWTARRSAGTSPRRSSPSRTTPSGSPTCRPLGMTVQRGPTLDGLGEYYRETITESTDEPVDVAQALREAGAQVVVNYLPVGSEMATRHYAQAALEAGLRLRQLHAGVHRLRPRVGPSVRRRGASDRRGRHQESRSAPRSSTGSWPSCSRTGASSSTGPTS